MKKRTFIIMVYLISFFTISLFLNSTFSYSPKTLTTDSGFDSSWDSGGSDYDYDMSYDRYEGKNKKSTSRTVNSTEFGVGFILATIFTIYCIRFEGMLKDSSLIKKILLSLLSILIFGTFFFMPMFLIYELIYKLVGNLFVFILLNIIVIGIIAFILYKKYKEKKTNEETRLKKIEDNHLNEEKIVKEAFDIYKRVQIAWMDDSIDDVSDCISDEMLNMYKAQLTTLRIKKQQNIMEDIKFVSGYIKNVTKSKDFLNIRVILNVDCKDYLIKKDSKKVVRGNSNRINHYEYSLTFSMPLKDIENCPNCGAKLKKGGGTKCPSCKSKIVANNKMIMVGKKMNKQS